MEDPRPLHLSSILPQPLEIHVFQGALRKDGGKKKKLNGTKQENFEEELATFHEGRFWKSGW